MKNWCNLHNHTTFSLLDGHGKVEEYAERAKQLQMGALAITDHGNIHGWLDFYDACKEVGIKPILGIESYQARKTRFDRDEEERTGQITEEMDIEQRGPYHLTIMAQNYSGYKNLIKLSSRAYTEGYYGKMRVDHQLLSEHSDGLIVLSGCLQGEVSQALMRGDYETALNHAATMQEIIGRDNYFIEIHDHGIDEQIRIKADLAKIAKTIGAKVVASGDCHYVHKEDYYHHDLLLCAGTGAKVKDEVRFRFAGPEFHLKSYEEMLERHEAEWLDNTCHIADMVDIDLNFEGFHFPKYPDIPINVTVDDHFEEKVWDGAKSRFGEVIGQEYKDRLEYEIGVIKRMGFTEYFLVVGDIVGWAKRQGIRVGGGRGSAAGSLVSYCLRITDLDPIEWGLLFERFLIEGRLSLPDVDVDIDDRRRGEVLDYIRERYGEDRVAHIVTLSSVGARQAVRDAARVLDYDFQTGDKLSKAMPPPILGVSKTIEEAIEESEKLQKEYDNDPAIREIIDAAKGMEGVYRQTGIHAAGVVIAPGPITDYIPVMLGGKGKETVITSWVMERVEQCGMVKMDFLGLRNLGVIDMTIDLIREHYDEEVSVDNLSFDDADVYMDLKKGKSIGVFQLESSGMRSTMLDIQPDNIKDIMALVSLYRPGPMGSGMHTMYANRKHGKEAISYKHPILKDILNETYGLMIYQEDVINVLRHLGGFSVSEADNIRRIIGKKKLKEVGEYREKFIQGCKDTNNINPGLSNQIYSEIEYFAGYGFNLSHSASYSVLAYQTAWLKHYYPAAYMAALMTSVSNKQEKLAIYLNECRNMDVEVLPPSVTQSVSDFSLDSTGSSIVFGLGAVRGMGEAKVSSIMDIRDEESPYTGIHDFLRRADNDTLNKTTLQHLARSGALDELAKASENTLTRIKKMELLEEELEEIGIYVTEHPLEEIWPNIATDITCEIVDLSLCSDRQIVKVGGIISNITNITTKRKQKMYRLTFQDLSSETEVIVFPREAEKLIDGHLSVGAIGILQGSVMHEGDDENFESKIVYNSFSKLDVEELLSGPPIILEAKEKLTTKQLSRLRDIIKSRSGDSRVFLKVPESGHTVTLKFIETTSINMTEKLQEVVNCSQLVNMEIY